MDLSKIIEVQDNLRGLVFSLTAPNEIFAQIERLKLKNPEKDSFYVGWRYVESGMATNFMEDLMKGLETQLNNYISINPSNFKTYLADLLVIVRENEEDIKSISRRNDKDWPSLKDAIDKIRTNRESLTVSQQNEYFIYRIHEILYISVDVLKEVLSHRINHPQITNPVQQVKKLFNVLADAVVSNEAELQIYDTLVGAKLIDSESKIFIDNSSGSKGFFYSTLILFFEKGYFLRRPTMDEYLNICENTFKLSISISTAKNHQTRPAGLRDIPGFTIKLD